VYMVKADCLNEKLMVVHCARLRGGKGIDACVRCCMDIPPVRAELSPEPAHKEWENDVMGAYVHTAFLA
jgi:hypothetical protein